MEELEQSRVRLAISSQEVDSERTTDGRIIERLYGVTKRSKLFVSPNKVSIRFKDNLTQPERDRIESFLLRASSQVVCNKTVRGHLACHRGSNTYYIVLQDGCGSYSKRITELDV